MNPPNPRRMSREASAFRSENMTSLLALRLNNPAGVTTIAPVASRMRRFVLLAVVATMLLSATPHSQAGAGAPPTLEIEDFVATPITGSVDGAGSNDVLLSRVNTIREEVGGANRLFVSDLNGPLHIFDKKTKTFTGTSISTAA